MQAYVRLTLVGLIIVLGIAAAHVDDWGFYGHREINKYAVFTLPPEIIGFYKKHIGYVSEHAVDPDKRRYATKHEAVRHYIDIDHWGVAPFDNVPRNFSDAIARYSDLHLPMSSGDTLQLRYQDRIGGAGVYKWTQDGETFRVDSAAYHAFFGKEVQREYYEEVWSFDPLQLFPTIGTEYIELLVVDRFSSYGILPYHLERYQRRLTRAFEAGDVDRILQISADMGHYVGDAHVPLHTTENYNGAMTNQIGIHAFWESRIPELMAAEEYDFLVGKAEYIENPREYYWDIVLTSHSYLDSVLLVEKRVRASLSQDEIYCFENRLDRVVRTQCEGFTRKYSEAMRGMVERRMTQSVQAIGSVWFSAWVDAGQPDLGGDVDYDLLKAQAEEWSKDFQQGDPKGRAHGG